MMKKVLIAGLALRVVLMAWVWHPDVWNHMDWGVRFFEYGARGFYAPEANVWSYTWPNQPPGTIYMYVGIKMLYDVVFATVWWVNVNVPLFPSNIMFFLEGNLYPAMLKLPAIMADLGIAWLIYKIVGRRKEKLGAVGAGMYLLNPAVWYNSAVWGQTDSVINFFVLVAFYLVLKKRLRWAMAAFALSLYLKVSLLIMLPVFGVVVWKMKCKTREVMVAIALALGLVGLFTLPFSGGEPFSWLYWLYTKKIMGQQLQVITANAFNVWAALTGIHEQPHTKTFLVFSYQVWGYALFGAALGAVLWRLKKRKLDEEAVWWSLAMVAFSAFMLLTNMHERYLFPLFPYFTIIVARERGLRKLYWLVSGVSLLNLYNFWWMPRIGVVVALMSFGDRLMPRVLGLIMFVAFWGLWRAFLFHTDEVS